MPDVLAVVSNYKRPQSMAQVVTRLVEDGGCDIIIANNAADELDYFVLVPWQRLHSVWTWDANSGPPARWYPALAFSHQYRYVLLVDDDHLPSRGIVKSLVAQAERLQDKFSVIGRIGRNFACENGKWRYVRRNVRHGNVDMAGAGYFLVARYLPCAILLRDELAAEGCDPRMLFHDDMVLNCSIQRATGYPSVMPEQPWSEKRLPTCGYAFNDTSDYRDVRDDLIGLCAKLGWQSVKDGGGR